MPGPRDEVERALDVALETVGPGVLTEPRRLRAILADLVGAPGSDHRDEIDAVVAAAHITTAEEHTDQDSLVTELVRHETEPPLAQWATTTLAQRDERINATSRTTRATPLWRRRWAVAAAVAVPLVALALSYYPPPPDPPEPGAASDEDPASDQDTTSSSSTSTRPDAPPPSQDTSTPTGPPESTGWTAEFTEAPEGVLLAARTWNIEDGRLSGSVTLTPTSESGVATHRELLPSEGFVNPTFDPEPSTTSGDVATFAIDQAAGPQTISFEAELTDPDPDEATVRSWYDVWRNRVPGLTPLDDQPPAEMTITPLG